MSKKKKVALSLLGVAAVLAVGVGVYYFQILGSLMFDVRYAEKGSPGSDQYLQWFVTISGYSDHPILRSREADMEAFDQWSNDQAAYLGELCEKGLPLNVKVDCKVDSGKTIFSYDGEITTEDGETVSYHQERIFNWTFATNEELSQLEKMYSFR